jgi:uncharacterized protein YfaP (DUF2135 family)
MMTWHADNTDIDLWVTEPSGEKAYYGHNCTTIGGLVSRDFTKIMQRPVSVFPAKSASRWSASLHY